MSVRAKVVTFPWQNDFWRHDPPMYGMCWVCGDMTMWVYLDLGWQHPSCDWGPGRKVVRGREERTWM